MLTIFLSTYTLFFGPTAASESTPDKLIFDFKNTKEGAQWRPVNDTVMGGVSRSRIEVTAQGTAVFRGEVSLANNGGFASIRSRPANHNLKGYQGVVLRIKGDGQQYKLGLKLDSRRDGPSYRINFPTQKGRWITVRIPFAQLVPTFRGRVLRNQPKVDPARIKSFSLMIADKQTGPFRLEVDWIGAYAPAARA